MKYKVNDSCIGCRRSLFRRTIQPQHHWFCHRFCADDGIGCGDGVIVFCGKLGNYILLFFSNTYKKVCVLKKG